MRTWLYQFRNSSRETKWFTLNSIAYAFLIILSTVYCYARIEFVRSGKPLIETSQSK